MARKYLYTFTALCTGDTSTEMKEETLFESSVVLFSAERVRDRSEEKVQVIQYSPLCTMHSYIL